MGADLYPFFHHYTRAAAAYFLQSEPGGSRPSLFWPKARSELASTLDWLSSPSSTPLYREFALSPRQSHIAKAFGDYTYRFALCHEVAHVVLGHVDAKSAELRTVGEDEVAVLQASHEQEFDADAFGLEIQLKSLPDPTQLVTALVSAIYFVHITGVLDGRLMLLAHLVDPRSWKIAKTHPPALARVLNLMGAAEGLKAGAGQGLREVHGSLAGLDGELYDTANKQRDEVAAPVGKLIDSIVRRGKPAATKTRSGKKSKVSGRPVAGIASELLRLFDRSPLGVMRALEPREHEDGAHARDRVTAMDQFSLELPSEFQRFRPQTPAERASGAA